MTHSMVEKKGTKLWGHLDGSRSGEKQAICQELNVADGVFFTGKSCHRIFNYYIYIHINI